MNRQRLLRSAVLGSLQVVVAGVVYLIYYRFLLEAIGAGALGMWSVVVAATAVGRVADLGVASGLSPFIARALANDDTEAAAGYAETAVVTVLVVVGLTLVLLYPLARTILGLVIPPSRSGWRCSSSPMPSSPSGSRPPPASRTARSMVPSGWIFAIS